MAQIKKLQKGNVFTIDGVAHNVDDALIGRLYDHAKSLDSGDAAQFGKIIDALKNGENLSYDSAQNKLTGTVNWDITNERQKRRVSKRLKAPMGIVANTQNAVGALKTFSPVPVYVSSKKEDKKDEKKKTRKDWSKGYAVTYTINDDGSLTLDSSVANQYAKNLLRRIHEINTYTDDDEFLGYGGADKDFYKTWLSARVGDSSTDELLKRLENGTLSEQDWKYLNEVGITNGTAKDPDSDQKARFKKAGLDWNKYKDYFNIDDSGNIDVTDAFKTKLGINGNFWFNSNWQNVDPNLDILRNRILWNGRLYNDSDRKIEGTALHRALSARNGFYDMLRSGNIEGANKLMEFTDDVVLREKYDPNKFYSSFFNGINGGNVWYSSARGSHKVKGDGLAEGQQLVRYYESGPNEFGEFGNERFAVIDRNGNFVKNLSPEEVELAETYTETPLELLAVDQSHQDDSVYGKTIQESYSGGTANRGIDVFYDPNNPDGDIIVDLGNSDGTSRFLRDGAFRLPKALTTYLQKNMTKEQQRNFWTLIASDRSIKERFDLMLADLVRSDFGQIFTSGVNQLSDEEWSKLLGTNNSKIIADLKNKIHAEGESGSKYSRRDYFIVPRKQVPSNQRGGTIGINSGTYSEKIAGARPELSANGRNINELDLTSADKWQIGSIAGDVAALVANMSGAGAPVGAVFGLAGTGAQLISDIKRDGFDWGDVGSLALNLGLDAATLLPNAGMSSMAKIGRGLTKSAGLIKKVLMGVGAVRGVQGLTNIINGEGTLDDWKALSQGLLVGQRAIKSGRNLAATKYQPKNAKTTPQTKEGIQKQYIEKFVAANKDKVQGTIKGMSAEGKVTNLSEAKTALKDVEGFSLPDKKASAKAAGSQVKGFFSSKWNPFSDQFVLNAENRVLSPKTMAAIKAGNSVWRSNAAYELGYLNPAIHKQIYTAGMSLPKTFGFNDPYIGNWFFRAPVFTKNGMTQTPTATPTSSVVPTPIVYNNTYRAPYAIKAGNLSEVKPTSLPSPTPKPAYIAPGLTVEQVAVPKQVVPVATYEPIPVGNGVQLQLPFPQPYVQPTVRVRNIPMPTISPSILQQYGFGRGMSDYARMRALGIHPIENATQQTLFKKGGKVKKIRKCENGLPGYAQGLDLGIRFDNQGNIVTIDPVTGLPKEPTLAEIGRATQLIGVSKTSTPAVPKGGNAIDLNELAVSQPHLYRNNAGEIVRRPKLKTDDVFTTGGEGAYGNGGFTQGSDKKTPYNWKPATFAATELGTSIGSAIVGGNKSKEAVRLQAEASKTFTPYETGLMYSDQHIGRAEDTAYKALDNQAPIVSNDPSMQHAYELAKAKERINIANNANAQRSAGITAWNQEEAQRNYRNRVRGAENQQSARKAELLTGAQSNLIDATTNQSVANSIKGFARELRQEDLYNTADKNTLIAQDAQNYGRSLLHANITNKYRSEIESEDVQKEIASKYDGDVVSWFADKHPGEFASMYANVGKQSQDYYAKNKHNIGILPLSKKGSKFRPTSDVMLIENQKHVNKSIRDLNSNLVKMFLKMMS